MKWIHRVTVGITFLCMVFNGVPCLAQSLMQMGAIKPVYVTIQPTMSHQNIQMYGFAQEIPKDFEDVTSIYKQGFQPMEKKVVLVNSIVDQLDEQLKISPENDILLLKKSILLYEKKSFKKAEALLMRLVDRSAKLRVKEESFFYLGLISATLKEFENSEYFFQEVLEYNSKRYNAVINKGLSQFLGGTINKALQTFEEAKILDSENSLSYYYIGIVQHLTGADNDVLKDLDVALKFKNDDKLYNITKNQISETNKKIASLSSAIQKDPKNADWYFELARVYSSAGQLVESNNKFLKAVEIYPKHYGALAGLSENYLFMGDYKSAEFYANEIWRHYPHMNFTVLLGKGRIRVYAADYFEAEIFLLQALEYAPPERAYLARSYLGQMYISQGNVGKAREQLEEALDHRDARDMQELAMKIRHFELSNDN